MDLTIVSNNTLNELQASDEELINGELLKCILTLTIG